MQYYANFFYKKHRAQLGKASKKGDFYHFGVWPPQKVIQIFSIFLDIGPFLSTFLKNIFAPRKAEKISKFAKNVVKGGCISCTLQRVGRTVQRVGCTALCGLSAKLHGVLATQDTRKKGIIGTCWPPPS